MIVKMVPPSEFDCQFEMDEEAKQVVFKPQFFQRTHSTAICGLTVYDENAKVVNQAVITINDDGRIAVRQRQAEEKA